MISPLFNILERNLGVPNVDKAISDTPPTFKRSYRETSQKVIGAWLVANELVNSGMNKTQASKVAGARFSVGWSNLVCNWNRIAAAAIKHGENHGE